MISRRSLLKASVAAPFIGVGLASADTAEGMKVICRTVGQPIADKLVSWVKFKSGKRWSTYRLYSDSVSGMSVYGQFMSAMRNFRLPDDAQVTVWLSCSPFHDSKPEDREPSGAPDLIFNSKSAFDVPGLVVRDVTEKTAYLWFAEPSYAWDHTYDLDDLAKAQQFFPGLKNGVRYSAYRVSAGYGTPAILDPKTFEPYRPLVPVRQVRYILIGNDLSVFEFSTTVASNQTVPCVNLKTGETKTITT